MWFSYPAHPTNSRHVDQFVKDKGFLEVGTKSLAALATI